MLCNIQGVLEIDVPEQHKDIVTAYNTEWAEANGQGFELQHFIKLTKDRKSLLDVGGNIGFFSQVFCLNNNEDNLKRAYCFEPSPYGLSTCVEILDHNDWFDRIKMFPLFIGDKEDTVEILIEETKTFVALFEKQDKNHGIIDRGGRSRGTMITLDNFVWMAEMGAEEEKYGLDLVFEDKREITNKNYAGFKEDFNIDTVKIDVEGYEEKVLKGAKEMLKKYKPLMFLEIHGHLLKLYNSSIMGVYSQLMEAGYKIFNIHDQEIKNGKDYINMFKDAQEIRVICRGE